MRLTLRTLLAYLDDLLEPAQARDLGERIDESPFATSIVTKIQDVVRRRRVGAPEVSGPGSRPDPNIVAEYLDNTLPPDAISELERICLESDPHLAEVAACHQVLTLVLGKPVDVPPLLRERMYSLGAVAPDPVAGNGAVRHVPKVVGVGAADMNRDLQPRSGEQDLLAPRPARPPGRTGWKRAVPYVAGAAILAGWGYLIVTDYFPSAQDSVTKHAAEVSEFDRTSGGGPGEGMGGPADGPKPQDGAETAVSTSPDTPALNEPIDVELQADGALASTGLPAPGVPPAPTEADGARVADEQPAAAAAEGDVDRDVTDGPDDAVPAGNELVAGGDAEPMPDAVEPPLPPQLPAFQVQYANNEGVLIHRDTADDQWAVTPRRALVFPEEEIASPDPFDARLNVSDQGPVCEVILRSGTRIRFLPATADTRLGWEIDQGRLVITRKGSPRPDESLLLRLKIREDEWLCTLTGPDTTLGIEVIPVPPTGVGDMSGATACGGSLQLVTGAARLKQMATQQAIELLPERGLLPLGTAVLEPEAASVVPDWMLPSTGPGSLSRHFSVKYEKEFLPDQPVAASIRPVVKDKQPRISELATGTLAMTGNLPGLVDALSAPHQESRIAAIEGLRRWLPRNEQHGVELDAELQNRFRGDAASAIGRLLWGYGAQDMQNKAASQELVDWLTHDEIAVRELAFYHVQRLTGRTYGYRADRRADEREAAVRHWRERLVKTGTLASE